MKGVLLAGGRGARMSPVTDVTNKHLLPIYDRPMIYYPLTSLVAAGVNEIFILTSSEHTSTFFKLLGDGSNWGCRFSYAVQEEPLGTGDGLLRAEQFASGQDLVVVLGDNVFTEDLRPYVTTFPEEKKQGFKAKILVS